MRYGLCVSSNKLLLRYCGSSDKSCRLEAVYQLKAAEVHSNAAQCALFIMFEPGQVCASAPLIVSKASVIFSIGITLYIKTAKTRVQCAGQHTARAFRRSRPALKNINVKLLKTNLSPLKLFCRTLSCTNVTFILSYIYEKNLVRLVWAVRTFRCKSFVEGETRNLAVALNYGTVE